MTARNRHTALFVLVMMLMVSLACTPGDTAAPQATNTPEIFPVTETPVAQITPTPVPSDTCPRPEGWQDYVVGEGEDLATIAAKFNTSMVSLAIVNCLPVPTLIPGQTLFVPPVTPTDTPTPTTIDTPTPTPCILASNLPVYTAQPGDTLSAIALATGSTVSELKVTNCLSGDLIIAGQRLYVPRLPSTPTDTPTPTATPTPSVGSIQGEVTDFSGPIGGAKVEVQLAGLEATTDPNGRYFFSNIPPGEEFVTVGAPLHLSAFQAVTVRPGQTATADFALIGAIPGPCPPLLRGTVEGRVLIESRPATGARVWIWGEPFEAVANKVGWYVIPDACGELILAEWGDMRGGIVVQISPRATITAPDIMLSPR